MRRKDREVTDISEINALLAKTEVCRLGLSDNSQPYIVPLNFGYVLEDRSLTMYFHCAKSGRKLDIIANNTKACFELEGDCRVVPKERAEEYTMVYESLYGEGQVTIVDCNDEKIKALRLIMQQVAPGNKLEITEKTAEMVAVIRLDVSMYSCKANRKG